MPARPRGAGAAGGQRRRQRQQRHRSSAAAWLAAAAAPLLLVLLLAAAAASAAESEAPQLPNSSPHEVQGAFDDLPTESDALAAGLGYLPSTDPSGMILLPRPLDALPPQMAAARPLSSSSSGLAVLAASSPSNGGGAGLAEERAEAVELQRLEQQEGGKTGGDGAGGWALVAVVGAGRRAAAALAGGGSPRPGAPAAQQQEAKTDKQESGGADNDGQGHDDDVAARRDAFAAAVQADLKAALDDARAQFPDGEFPAPVAAAAAARVLSARTPEELRSRTAAFGEARRRLLNYAVGNPYSTPCGPSCAPGACLPEVNPFTYAQTGTPGYVPGPFTGTGGHKFREFYNGNGVVGLFR